MRNSHIWQNPHLQIGRNKIDYCKNESFSPDYLKKCKKKKIDTEKNVSETRSPKRFKSQWKQ